MHKKTFLVGVCLLAFAGIAFADSVDVPQMPDVGMAIYPDALAVDVSPITIIDVDIQPVEPQPVAPAIVVRPFSGTGTSYYVPDWSKQCGGVVSHWGNDYLIERGRFTSDACWSSMKKNWRDSHVFFSRAAFENAKVRSACVGKKACWVRN